VSLYFSTTHARTRLQQIIAMAWTAWCITSIRYTRALIHSSPPHPHPRLHRHACF